MENVIELKNVYKKFNIYIDKRKSLKEKILFPKSNKYTERVVLEDVSLKVKKGEVIGLIGNNGCGKSTLLKLISKIMYPEKGSVEVKGRVSSLIELGAGFHPDMSGRENIYTNAAILGLSKKQIEEKISQIIDFSELGDFIDNPVRTYSSGMYMRLAFAVAINVDADILLIDEILAVGDVVFQKKCFNKLKEIKEKGTTIVIVSHSLGQIEKICDKSYWIDEGKIVCEGIPKEVHKKYLEFMNNSEIYEELEEEENVLEEVEIKEEIPPQKAEKRWGNKEVEIAKVTLLDENNIVKDTFKTGEKVKIKINYKANKKIKNAVVGFAIFRDDGVNCYGTNTNIDKLKGITLNSEGEIICEIKNELLEGVYFLDVAFHTIDEVAYDYYKEALTFKMVNNIKEVGVTKLEHTWEF